MYDNWYLINLDGLLDHHPPHVPIALKPKTPDTKSSIADVHTIVDETKDAPVVDGIDDDYIADDMGVSVVHVLHLSTDYEG